MFALLTQSPSDTVQTGTGKVDSARKFKYTTAAREVKTYKNMRKVTPFSGMQTITVNWSFHKPTVVILTLDRGKGNMKCLYSIKWEQGWIYSELNGGSKVKGPDFLPQTQIFLTL